ncbi:glycosyltransferase [Solwaraspora sp. WMMD406]|uniref:glycosyltransferase n=1 Tax=Solwaraspora sp. WMMD406 TaxID=3016095 RepID=UPI00241705CA|nr:glycosyltransferase [Solwaraspora sp. WMMD406]MDG4763490.1 glycosyltransferase [Solwaraspora sp. WMMD406]
MGAPLSAVVPIYNVARYLTDCLDSLAGQTCSDVEFILVDDGSTDGSGDIAAARAAADPRFRLIRQPNRGLGAARNAGIRAAVGDYLTFVDSDDIVPPYAFELLVGALETTGSQIASGNVMLFNSRGSWQSPLHRGTHRQTWLGTRLSSRRNLIYDRLACNKVFRRDFWTGHDLWFPEGVRYEDIPVTIPAYALAETIDVLSTPVYYWRQREAGADESISQRQAEVANLVDRFAAVRNASRSLAALGDRTLKNRYDEIALRSDLRMFLYLLPEVTDEAYRRRFVELAGEFLAEVDPAVPGRLDPGLRVAWHLARTGRLAELLVVVAATRSGAEPPAVSGVPAAWYRPSRRLRATARSLRWHDGRLRISGYAYRAPAATVPASGGPAPRPLVRGALSLRGLWLRERGRPRRGLPRVVPLRRRPVLDVADDGAPTWSGFDVALRPSALRTDAGWRPGTWSVMTGLADTEGKPTSVPLKVGEIAPALPAAWVEPGVRVVPTLHDGAVRLRVERPTVWATMARIDGDELLISGVSVDAGAVPDTLTLSWTQGLVWRRYPVGGDGAAGFVCRIPLADLCAGAGDGPSPMVGDPVRGWLVGYTVGADRRIESGDRELPVGADFSAGVGAAGDTVVTGTGRRARSLLVEPGDGGQLWIRILPPGPLLTWVAGDPDGIVLGGVRPAGQELTRIVLRHADDLRDPHAPADREVPVDVTGDGWLVRISGSGPDLPEPGRWWLGHRPASDDRADDPVHDLPAALRVREGLDVEWAAGRLRWEPDRLHRVALVVR